MVLWTPPGGTLSLLLSHFEMLPRSIICSWIISPLPFISCSPNLQNLRMQLYLEARWLSCNEVFRCYDTNRGLPWSSEVKTPPASAADVGSIPGSGRSPGGGNGSPLQYSCLGSCMDGGVWRAAGHGVTKELDTTTIQHQMQSGGAGTDAHKAMTLWGHRRRWWPTAGKGRPGRLAPRMPRSYFQPPELSESPFLLFKHPCPLVCGALSGQPEQTNASTNSLDNIKLLYSNPTISIVYQPNASVKINFPSITIWSPMGKISTGRTR